MEAVWPFLTWSWKLHSISSAMFIVQSTHKPTQRQGEESAGGGSKDVWLIFKTTTVRVLARWKKYELGSES